MTFNPKTVDRHALEALRRQNKRDVTDASLYGTCALLLPIIGFSLWLSLFFGALCLCFAGAGIVRLRRIQAVVREQEKVPLYWPPQELQCAICGSDAVDRIEYEGYGWVEFYGRKVHETCKPTIWPLWRPREIDR